MVIIIKNDTLMRHQKDTKPLSVILHLNKQKKIDCYGFAEHSSLLELYHKGEVIDLIPNPKRQSWLELQYVLEVAEVDQAVALA